MGAVEVLHVLSAAGIHLEVRGDTLHASPRDRLTDEHRGLIRQHKGELVALMTEPRRLWLIRHDDGTLASHSFSPPATLAEVRGWYPGALAVEPETERTAVESDRWPRRPAVDPGALIRVYWARAWSSSARLDPMSRCPCTALMSPRRRPPSLARAMAMAI